MNIIETLIERYTSSESTKEITNYLQKKKLSRLQLQGLTGSQKAFIIISIYKQHKTDYLYIANNKEEAAYLQNDIANLIENKEIRFFQDSFKQPRQFKKLVEENVLQRTEVVNKIAESNAKGEIVVTYPEALFEKVIAPSTIEKHKLEIKKGEEVDTSTIIEVLTDYGFKREEFVYTPGQYSIRGGIVDIFSYGNDYPYRVELFDEEVDSIRTFDPLTQLSKSNIAKVSIIPNINTQFDSSEKVSIFPILKEDCVVIVEDVQTIIDHLQGCFEEALKFGESISALDKSELAEIFRSHSFIKPAEIIQEIEAHPIICISNKKQTIDFENKITFQSKAQPNFNKNFKFLIEDLEHNSKANITNYLFTENARQAERFHNIFEDLNASVQFQPILKSIHKGFVDSNLKIACYTDHQIFDRFHRYKLRQGYTKDKALNVRLLRELQPGDFVTHIDHGVGQYSGLEKININGHTQEAVRLFYRNKDVLYVSIHSLHKISKYIGKDGKVPKLDKIGSDAWSNLKRKTKKKVKDIAGELIKLYAKRRASEGHAFPEDGYLQNELEASFIYEDTPDQYKATQAMKEDMMKAYPMDRLICGDVGFGKTEVAIRGAFKAVADGKQVAVLVPTTILALQHNKTFSSRLDEFGVTVDYVNRFRTTKEKNEIYKRLAEGEIDIVIGTHALLNQKVKFKDLGLLVIDEEQKFGVSAKEKLRNFKVNVDTLTLTATPIPRTLQFSLMAARDLSIMRTPPPNRQPIHTEVRIFNDEVVKESIYYEVMRGGQVFFVHNRVKSLPNMVDTVRRLCPDVDVAMAHGQMESKALEKTLLDFINKEYDVLICTNIIETGLDIPNANTIIINNAHQFGMSDLHQLRGRVGRSNKKAFCYLFCPPMSTLTSDARKRLETLEEFSDLGSGFNIAMRDLDIRGAGNLLGAEQSGFIADIGYEMYQKILEEAIQELKENEFKGLFKEEIEKERNYVRDVTLDVDVEMYIPDNYISNIQERLNLYTQLDKIEDEAGIENFTIMLRDRFGKIPKSVMELFEGLRLRWLCKSLGFERITLKSDKLRCYFVENPQSSFYESEHFEAFFQFLGKRGDKFRLSIKKTNRHLIVIREGIKNISSARAVLEQIEKELHLT